MEQSRTSKSHYIGLVFHPSLCFVYSLWFLDSFTAAEWASEQNVRVGRNTSLSGKLKVPISLIAYCANHHSQVIFKKEQIAFFPSVFGCDPRELETCALKNKYKERKFGFQWINQILASQVCSRIQIGQLDCLPISKSFWLAVQLLPLVTYSIPWLVSYS